MKNRTLKRAVFCLYEPGTPIGYQNIRRLFFLVGFLTFAILPGISGAQISSGPVQLFYYGDIELFRGGREPFFPQPVPFHPDSITIAMWLDFGLIKTGERRGRAFGITNRGPEDLKISTIVSDNPNFTVPSTGFVLPPGTTRGISVPWR